MTERIISYSDALREALELEMARDERVLLIGQGIADRGGSFGVTRGLADRFGIERVIDTPIAEASVTGMSIGAAIQGQRPVLEHASIDFTLLAMDQIVNQAAKYHFITGGRCTVPLVIRTQGGAGTSAAMHHSQSLEALFYHIPGLKIAVPSTPADAKGLLSTAIRDDHPVIVIEHKLLYKTTGQVPEGDYTLPFGQASLRRTGADCTIVAWSRMANLACDAADLLESEGISCDVLDLRTLVPLDRASIIASVRRTGRLVVACEAVKRGSVASDIAAIAAEEAWDALKAPIIRVCGAVTPIPYNRALERAVTPDADAIAAGVRAVLEEKKA